MSPIALRPFLALLAASAVVSACTEFESSGAQTGFYSVKTQARVYALDATSFEVVPPLGAPAAAYWCAASEYARRALGAGWSQEIYVSKGRAPSMVTGRIDTITFSLSPVPRAEPAPAIRRAYGYKPGDSFSVSSAESYCYELDPILLF